MKTQITPDFLKNCSLEDYNNFYDMLFIAQEDRFKDVLKNMRYRGERPELPKYEITLVQKEHFREYKDCYLC